MTNIELIRKVYEMWKEIDEDGYVEFTEAQRRLMFLSDAIMGLTTYDCSMDIEFGQMFVDTMEVIKNKTTYKYIEDPENYKKYIVSCDRLDDCIEWGTSIRGAWFNYYSGKIIPDFHLPNIEGYTETFIKIDEPFITWFIKFIKNEES